MKMFRHLSSVFAIATIAPLALAATLAATPAIAQADQLSNPDWLALLSDYEKNYWQAPADAEHGGKVLDADTMKLDEDLAVAINHKAAEISSPLTWPPPTPQNVRPCIRAPI